VTPDLVALEDAWRSKGRKGSLPGHRPYWALPIPYSPLLGSGSKGTFPGFSMSVACRACGEDERQEVEG
jgi:hypothetical protein